MSDVIFQLVVRKGPKVGQAYPLLGDTLVIGRDPMADIVITDPEVSRQHARLTQVDDGYEIRDLGSTNGTFINGRRLGSESVRLTPGQEILVGSGVTLSYESSAGQAPTATLVDTAGAVKSPPVSPVRTYDEPEDEALADPPTADLPPLPERRARPAQPRTTQPPPRPAPARRHGAPLVPSGKNNDSRRRNMTIIVVTVLLLCCCCAFLLFMYYYGGDWLLQQMGLL